MKCNNGFFMLNHGLAAGRVEIISDYRKSGVDCFGLNWK